MMAGNERQSIEEYNPTMSEGKLLEVLLNPQYRMKSITDICKIAEISRTTYYDAFAKSQFVELYKQKSIQMLKHQIGPVLNTFVQEAKRGSYQHGKAFLEMIGVYIEKQQVESINTSFNTDLTNLSSKERKARIEELINKLQK